MDGAQGQPQSGKANKWIWRPGWLSLAGVVALAAAALLPAIAALIVAFQDGFGPGIPFNQAKDMCIDFPMAQMSFWIMAEDMMPMLSNTILLSGLKMLIQLPVLLLFAAGAIAAIRLVLPALQRRPPGGAGTAVFSVVLLVIGAGLGLLWQWATSLRAVDAANTATPWAVLAGSLQFGLAALLLGWLAHLVLAAARNRIIDGILLLLPAVWALLAMPVLVGATLSQGSYELMLTLCYLGFLLLYTTILLAALWRRRRLERYQTSHS